uniref:Uncharacterized protein n=1 Tax=Siphoviridae sp. ctrpg19 TaxID=2826481 RepID=A0A8S5MKI2_9CAUD|nr:MAG TPA: hypothetical protein [Siphoviridae sp. ctrpg19]
MLIRKVVANPVLLAIDVPIPVTTLLYAFYISSEICILLDT